MTDSTPILWWVRRDMRLGDNPALRAAIDADGPVIPVFVWDEVAERLGAAARWRMGLAVERFNESLKAIGSLLILRRGKALDCLRDLMAETGASEVCWSRLVDPASKARDEKVMAVLLAALGNDKSFLNKARSIACSCCWLVGRKQDPMTTPPSAPPSVQYGWHERNCKRSRLWTPNHGPNLARCGG